jgi:hypothetical protein
MDRKAGQIVDFLTTSLWLCNHGKDMVFAVQQLGSEKPE